MVVEVLRRVTFIFGVQVGQRNHLVAFGRNLHHVVGAVLATADERHDPHLVQSFWLHHNNNNNKRVNVSFENKL